MNTYMGHGIWDNNGIGDSSWWIYEDGPEDSGYNGYMVGRLEGRVYTPTSGYISGEMRMLNRFNTIHYNDDGSVYQNHTSTYGNREVRWNRYNHCLSPTASLYNNYGDIRNQTQPGLLKSTHWD